MNIKAEVTLALNVCLKVRHLEVIIDPVDDKVWEPGVLSSSLEKFIKQFKTLLPEIIAEYFETHKCLILG
jgi:hypothetical protein